MKKICRLLLGAALLPAAAAAHPHIFVDTAVKVIVSETGTLEAVEVTWAYDEFYSLLVLEDRGLDSDYDGKPTEAELAQLQGFDLAWLPDFEGDTYLDREGEALALGDPEHLSTEVEDGRITTRHRRALAQPVAADGVVMKVYDPTFYTAYTLNLGLEVTGGCQGEVTPPDLNAAYSQVEELLYAMPTQEAELEFPKVGEKFADVVRLRCEG